jgi:hypothetical protein
MKKLALDQPTLQLHVEVVGIGGNTKVRPPAAPAPTLTLRPCRHLCACLGVVSADVGGCNGHGHCAPRSCRTWRARCRARPHSSSRATKRRARWRTWRLCLRYAPPAPPTPVALPSTPSHMRVGVSDAGAGGARPLGQGVGRVGGCVGGWQVGRQREDGAGRRQQRGRAGPGARRGTRVRSHQARPLVRVPARDLARGPQCTAIRLCAKQPRFFPSPLPSLLCAFGSVYMPEPRRQSHLHTKLSSHGPTPLRQCGPAHARPW